MRISLSKGARPIARFSALCLLACLIGSWVAIHLHQWFAYRRTLHEISLVGGDVYFRETRSHLSWDPRTWASGCRDVLLFPKAVRLLDLKDTAIDDQWVERIKGLSECDIVVVSGTKMRGKGFKVLGNVHARRIIANNLQLDDNIIRSIPDTCMIEELDLRGSNGIANQMCDILSMPSLIEIDVSSSDVTDESFLCENIASPLISFRADYCSITFETLPKCVTLQYISATGSKLSNGGLRRICHEFSLRRLAVGENCGLTDEEIGAIGLLSSLEDCDLHCTAAGSKAMREISKCRNIRKLDLSDTDVEQRSVLALYDMPLLEEVDLSGTLVDMRAVVSLEAACGRKCVIRKDAIEFMDEMRAVGVQRVARDGWCCGEGR